MNGDRRTTNMQCEERPFVVCHNYVYNDGHDKKNLKDYLRVLLNRKNTRSKYKKDSENRFTYKHWLIFQGFYYW